MMVGIAQLVERWVVAPEVVSSNLASHPMFWSLSFILNYSYVLDMYPLLMDSPLQQEIVSGDLIQLIIRDTYDFNTIVSNMNVELSMQTPAQIISDTYSSNNLLTHKQESIHNVFDSDYNVLNDRISQLTPEQKSSKFLAFSGDLVFTDYLEYGAHRLDVELERIHKARPDLSKEKIYSLMTDEIDSDSIDFALWLHNHDALTIKSDIFYHKGKAIDVTKLSKSQIYGYLVTIDETRDLLRLEHVRSLFQASTPNQKLYYPAPFVAAPSYMHDDIFFIHILQYQFWLWFVFIFLIVFFFISFLCVARWCALRTQPRRETRGVSRSKCGDLITAAVPVTWAISIIVSETTDASDTLDGFSTKEIMVGIRAYQWGWEYYYPKAIDLQYSLKPSYSTFLGNSLKYSTTSELNLSANNVWKQYQNKATDKVITPAHLLVLPIDNNKMFNFMNFNDIGARTAVNSSAFTKIRTASKTFNTNLVHTPSTFVDKYKQINNLLDNENRFIESSVYGLKRQHNLTAWAATAANNSNFLDREGMEAFLNHTTKVELENQLTEDFTHNNEFGKFYGMSTNAQVNESFPTVFSNVTQKDTLLDSKLELVNPQNTFKTLQTQDVDSKVQNYINSSLTVPTTTVSFLETASNDESILGSEQSVRHMVELNRNPNNTPTNISESSLNKSFNGSVLAGSDLLNLTDPSTQASRDVIRLTNRSGYNETIYPIMSNNPKLSHLNYDSPSINSSTVESFNGDMVYRKGNTTSEVVNILQGRRDGALSGLNSTYWQMFWANSNSDLRVSSVLQSNFNTDSSYLPLFNNYYEYDFRNAQALELLEEAYWETSYSSYNHLDYLNIRESFKKTPYAEPYISRLDVLYYDENTEELLPEEDLLTPGIKDLSLLGQFYANIVQSEEPFSPSTLSLTKDFGTYPLLESVLNVDESFTNFKEHSLFFNQNNTTPLAVSSDYLYPQSYVSVLNNFRADFDDFSIHSESSSDNILTNSLMTDDIDDTDLMTITAESVFTNNTNRFSNPVTLRKTAKNSIVTYSAIQKVFRARLEEGRSNIKLSHFSDLYIKQPFMNESRIPYEQLLGKNRTSYYNNTFYNSSHLQSYNQFSTLSNSLNTWFYDFPFLLGMVSDGTRHFWFDWYAQWGMVEVQPSSLAKFSTIGVPYARKNYDFNLGESDTIQASDRYLNRISRARKNYLPNWLFTPYLYSRSQVWNKTNLNSILLHNTHSHSGHSRVLLTQMHWYWTAHFFTNQTQTQFTPSISGNNIYNKASWRPKSSIQSYHYHNTLLVDLLTKREFIYRQYFETNRKVIALPKLLTANPQHPLVRELKSSFLFIDPTTYNSEYSREVYYNSLDYFKFMLLKGWLLQLDQRITKAPINTTLVKDYFFYYFFMPQKSEKVGNTQDLYKSQFRPLKKGITSMLRLQGTGAVAMPIETRLQILASSRDVIHSWSVPSAGVKIDCIPGYTSHRIMTFLTPGIYWGQCQEICGRYHHWMPIVVYFMKRDLFFLWCTHFVFKNSVNGTSSNSDKQFNDYIRFASYDKTSWLSEVSKL